MMDCVVYLHHVTEHYTSAFVTFGLLIFFSCGLSLQSWCVSQIALLNPLCYITGLNISLLPSFPLPGWWWQATSDHWRKRTCGLWILKTAPREWFQSWCVAGTQSAKKSKGQEHRSVHHCYPGRTAPARYPPHWIYMGMSVFCYPLVSKWLSKTKKKNYKKNYMH